jgi:tRNA threonylcarbamoyladenosine modification (KEOPS) complex  Pcc1 subunit
MKIEMDKEKVPKDYIKIMDKPKGYERSGIEVKALRKSLVININAKDAHALIATLNSVVKQLRVISSTNTLIDESKY